jgi:hypothetical protein
VIIEQQAIIAEKGVLYVAYGVKAREQAQNSMQTLRRQMRGIPVAVVSDSELKGADYYIHHPEEDRGARTQKTQMYRLSPFKNTLFLDADTELISSPTPGFDLLNYVDLVLGQDVNRIFIENHWPHLNQEEVTHTKKVIGTSQHMYFNSGVIFFRRNERVQAMMVAWYEEWCRWKMHDQMALLRAIHRFPVRIAPMRAPWNTHHRSGAAFVFHKHRQARREGAPQ